VGQRSERTVRHRVRDRWHSRAGFCANAASAPRSTGQKILREPKMAVPNGTAVAPPRWHDGSHVTSEENPKCQSPDSAQAARNGCRLASIPACSSKSRRLTGMRWRRLTSPCRETRVGARIIRSDIGKSCEPARETAAARYPENSMGKAGSTPVLLLALRSRL